MKTIDIIWYQGFYRKNYLFFFILLFVFAFVAKPPYLFFSRYFITPMLESPPFLLGTLGLFLLYYLKGLRDSLVIIQLPQNRYVYELLLLPERKLYVSVARQLFLIQAPVILYLCLIAVYALIDGSGLWLPLVLGNALLFYLAVRLMIHHLRYPRERTYGQNWQNLIGKQFRKSMAYISLMNLWEHSRPQFIWLKSISLALTAALCFVQHWGEKALFLCFWCIFCLQAILFFRLRQKEDREIFSLRNLPLSRLERWANYLLLGIIMALPELMTWLLLGGAKIGLLHILVGYAGMAVLAIAILYHQALELGTFVSYTLGCFMVGFIILLFGLPLGVWGMGCLLFSWWIFWEEYYRWNGWERE